MSDLRDQFLRELVDFIRPKLNAHISKGGGLAEFINGYLRLPCNGDPTGRDQAAKLLDARREQLEKLISCPLFSVDITGLLLDAGMRPVWTLRIHPMFNSIDQSTVEYFVLEVHGHGYTLLEIRGKEALQDDALAWSIVLNELRIESTLDALKKTELPSG